MTAIRIICCSLSAILLAGCASAPSGPVTSHNYPGTLQPPQTLATQAVWQQRVTARWQQPGQEVQERGFDAALQRSGENLTVIGLSPMGSLGFSIQQKPDGIDVVNNMPEQLVIPPQFILLDVQRTFFPWLTAAQPGVADGNRAGLINGTHSSEIAGEEVTEVWLDDRLQQRTFRRLDNQPEGLITIDYKWQQPTWKVPSQAILQNGWFGYQLTIVTHSETLIGEANTIGEAAPPIGKANENAQ